MPYRCLQPLTHDGRAFAVGDKIPDDMITDDQARILIEREPERGGPVIERIKEQVSRKERKEIEAKEVRLVSVPDIQAMEQEEALNAVSAEQALGTLYRWQDQEKAGKRRAKVVNALRRQVLEIEKLQGD